MAERRMFSKMIIDSDLFLDMPTSSRLLYYDLAMRADDDGFINNPKKIARMTGASQDDLRLLTAKNFLIPFESGVVVIKHWKIHNYIQKDRYKPTLCQAEKEQLLTGVNKEYSRVDTDCIQNGYNLDTQVRIGKDRIGKVRLGESNTDSAKPKAPTKHKYGEFKHVLLTDEERDRLFKDKGEELTLKAIKKLDEYIEETGRKYKNHNLTLRRWVFDAINEKKSPKAFENEMDEWRNA